MSTTIASETPRTPRGQWATEPFVSGTDDDFQRLREWLVDARYTEAGLAETAGLGSIYEFPSISDTRRTIFLEPVDKQSLLVRLFLDGLPVPWTIIDQILSADDRAVLDRLGLLQTSVGDADAGVGTVALYPLERLFMISDRYGSLQLIGTGAPADLVYSALTPETHRFVELMPRYRCDDYLELCSGCGVAALIAAAQFAKTALAVDITGRSTRFAAFNARLNALPNVVPLEGNLYEPVAGRQFDLITAHPPYVASFGTEMIFRDGGEDGEQITRAVIAGLADHLRPGGQFYCDCTMTDREGAPLEQRVREMLGPRQHEFDVIVGQGSAINPVVQYAGGLVEGRSTPELFTRRVEAFKRLGITSFVSAMILIHRRESERPAVTRRRLVSGRTTAKDFQWLMDYLIRTSQWTDADVLGLLDTTPRLVDGTEWRTRMLAEGGEWRFGFAQLATTAPFSMEADNCPPWFASLLMLCDGRTVGREILRRLREAGSIPSASDDAQFARLLRQLADAAFVELPDFPLPDR
jgi:methylase of polypeptide subunit release factors